MQISEIMETRLHSIAPDQTLVQAAQVMRDEDVGALPVIEDERLIGMVTDRDIVARCIAEGADPRSVSVREAMSTDIAHCLADQSVEEAAKIMGAAKVRRLPVIDQDRRLVGIVALADLAREAEPGRAAEALSGVSEPTEAPRAL